MVLANRQSPGAASAAAQGLPLGGGLQRVVNPVVATPVQVGTSPQAPTAASTSTAGGVWAELRNCESGGNYSANTGNGFYGAYQFSQQTWTDLGMPGSPNLAPPSMQDAAAQKLQAASGWGQWPACAAALGLR